MANFKIAQVKIGQQRADQSFARIEVSAESGDALDDLILRLRQHGAEVAEKGDAQLAAAPADGIFPTRFLCHDKSQTFVRIGGKEIEVRAPMLDSAIMIDREQRKREYGAIRRRAQGNGDRGRTSRGAGGPGPARDFAHGYFSIIKHEHFGRATQKES